VELVLQTSTLQGLTVQIQYSILLPLRVVVVVGHRTFTAVRSVVRAVQVEPVIPFLLPELRELLGKVTLVAMVSPMPQEQLTRPAAAVVARLPQVLTVLAGLPELVVRVRLHQLPELPSLALAAAAVAVVLPVELVELVVVVLVELVRKTEPRER
jgi:hypothetical protein